MEICERLDCTGCGVCSAGCAAGCIEMCEDREGFLFPVIDETKCIGCKKCVELCPNHAVVRKYPSEFYMAIHKDPAVLQKSSSGGAFTALASAVLDMGGVVVGAEQDSGTRIVAHRAIERETELDRLRLSKYYQSQTQEIFLPVKKYLDAKRYVLFTGTTCQIAALYSFLGETEDPYLITADILCHGVTNKGVVDAYIKSKENAYKKQIVDYRFRAKERDGKNVDWYSGGNLRMWLNFIDGTHMVEKQSDDTFYMGFLSNTILRESCYRCKYCGRERVADFTLADFWGVSDERATKEQKKHGVSLLLVNSHKAKSLLPQLEEKLLLQPVEPEEAVPHNRCLIAPSKRPPARDKFFHQLENNGYDTAIKKVCRKYYLKYYLQKWIKNILFWIFGEKTVRKVVQYLKSKR